MWPSRKCDPNYQGKEEWMQSVLPELLGESVIIAQNPIHFPQKIHVPELMYAVCEAIQTPMYLRPSNNHAKRKSSQNRDAMQYVAQHVVQMFSVFSKQGRLNEEQWQVMDVSLYSIYPVRTEPTVTLET
jgi:hypothetical protein